MPYEWIKPPATPDAPLAELHLWPYRSLSRRGFVTFIGVTAGLLALPALALIGRLALWGLLPFLLGAIWAIWWALQRSQRDGEVLEELRIWPDRVELVRHDPKRDTRAWEANPYWITPHLHVTGGPVPNYLTLRGGPREVEIGAFLSEPERLALRDELQRTFARVTGAQA